MSAEARRGRWILAVILGITSLDGTVDILLHLAELSVILRWFFTAALLWALWEGHQWARWVTVGFAAAAFPLGSVAVLRAPDLIGIGEVTLCVATAVLLTFSSSVSAFLRHQRTAADENA